MTWRIELADTNDDLAIITVIKAQAIWKRLSKAAQAAVQVAYADGELHAHGNTMGSLERHGFVVYDHGWYLTEAGKQVARWNVKAKPEIPCGCIDSLWNGECECAASGGRANG